MTDLTTVLYDSTDAVWAFVVWLLILLSCTSVLSTLALVAAYRRRGRWMPGVLRVYGELRKLRRVV